MIKSKWQFQLFPEGIKFYSGALYRGEILTDRDIPKKHKKQIGVFLTKIINSYIEEKGHE